MSSGKPAVVASVATPKKKSVPVVISKRATPSPTSSVPVIVASRGKSPVLDSSSLNRKQRASPSQKIAARAESDAAAAHESRTSSGPSPVNGPVRLVDPFNDLILDETGPEIGLQEDPASGDVFGEIVRRMTSEMQKMLPRIVEETLADTIVKRHPVSSDTGSGTPRVADYLPGNWDALMARFLAEKHPELLQQQILLQSSVVSLSVAEMAYQQPQYQLHQSSQMPGDLSESMASSFPPKASPLSPVTASSRSVRSLLFRSAQKRTLRSRSFAACPDPTTPANPAHVHNGCGPVGHHRVPSLDLERELGPISDPEKVITSSYAEDCRAPAPDPDSMLFGHGHHQAASNAASHLPREERKKKHVRQQSSPGGSSSSLAFSASSKRRIADPSDDSSVGRGLSYESDHLADVHAEFGPSDAAAAANTDRYEPVMLIPGPPRWEHVMKPLNLAAVHSPSCSTNSSPLASPTPPLKTLPNQSLQSPRSAFHPPLSRRSSSSSSSSPRKR
eukprot:ANDGO_05678.mRNA.1 hypothetical protein